MVHISVGISTWRTKTGTHYKSIKKVGKASFGFRREETWDFALRPQNNCRSLHSFHWALIDFLTGINSPTSPLAVSSRVTCEIHRGKSELAFVYACPQNMVALSTIIRLTHEQLFRLQKVSGDDVVREASPLQYYNSMNGWDILPCSFDNYILNTYEAQDTVLGDTEVWRQMSSRSSGHW